MREIGGRFLHKAHSCNIQLSSYDLRVDGVTIVEKDSDNRFVSTLAGVDPTDHEQSIKDYHLRRRANVIAELLNNNQRAEAIFLANLFDWNKLNPGSSLFSKAGFNPFQPRDFQGQWSKEGQSYRRSLIDIAYEGKYHDQVVDDIKKVLEAQGSIVLKGVRVGGLNSIFAIPDGLVKPVGSSPYFIEVKTGFDPKPTPEQAFVDPLICIGGHATSFDSRLTQLGLTPGAPFPPMDIWFAIQSTPKDKGVYFNYCEAIGIRRKFNVP